MIRKSPRMEILSDGQMDLVIENGRIPWAENGEQVAQRTAQRLKQFYGESVFHSITGTGTKWYQVILDVSKSRAEKEYEIKRVLLTTPGVTSLASFTWEQTARGLSITAVGITEYGDLDLNGEIVL